MRTRQEIQNKYNELKNDHTYFKSVSEEYLNNFLKNDDESTVSKYKFDFADLEMRRIEELLKILSWVLNK